MAWLTGWGKRKSHVITGSADGALTDYQVDIDVYRKAGTDSAAGVYVGADCRSDFGDIRFALADETTEITHWADKPRPAFGADLSKNITRAYIAADGAWYVADNAGKIWSSVDEGANYTEELYVPSATGFRCLFVSTNGEIYASPWGAALTNADAGLYVKKSGTWSRVLALVSDGAGNYEQIWAIDEDSSGRVYAGVYTSGTAANARIYRSTDDGASFASFWSASGGLIKHIHSICVDKNVSPNKVYWSVGDTGLSLLYRLPDTTAANSSAVTQLWATGQDQLLGIVATATCRLIFTDCAGQRQKASVYRTTDDTTFTEVWRTGGTNTNIYDARINPLTGNIYAFLFTDTTSSQPNFGSIVWSNDDGLTWAGFDDATVYEATGTTGYTAASNFYNNECFVVKKLAAGYQAGKRLVDNSVRRYTLKIPTLAQSTNQTIYTYYSKADATESISTNAFVFHDHFATLDTTNTWNEATTTDVTKTVANSTLKLSLVTNPTKTGLLYSIYSKTAYAQPCALVMKVNRFSAYDVNRGRIGLSSGFGAATTRDHYATMMNGNDGVNEYLGSLLTKDGTTSSAYTPWSEKIREGLWTIKARSGNVQLDNFSGNVITKTTNTPTASLNIDLAMVNSTIAGGYSELELDWVAVRKYTTNEPTHGTWGTEETAPASGDPQTITFNPLAATTYGAAPITLTATASSGLPVSYASSNTAVATVSGSTVTIVGVGTTNITATQAGDGTWAAATPVVQALTVAKAAQTISISAPSYKLPTDAPFTVTATATSGLACTLSILSGPATILGGTVTLTGALGDVVIRATQAGNANYNAAADTERTVHVVEELPVFDAGALSLSLQLTI